MIPKRSQSNSGVIPKWLLYLYVYIYIYICIANIGAHPAGWGAHPAGLPQSNLRVIPESSFDAEKLPRHTLKHVEKALVFRDSKPAALFVEIGCNPNVIPKRSQSNPNV